MWNNPPCGKHIHFTIIKTRCDYKTQLVENTPRVVTEVVTKVSSLRNEIWQKYGRHFADNISKFIFLSENSII